VEIRVREHADEEPALPARWAFVVQFEAGTDPVNGRYAGRVEHVVSGAAARFETLTELLAFVAQVLEKARLEHAGDAEDWP